MYRCRSFHLLVRKTRNVLTSPNQSARCEILGSHAGSQRNFADSVGVTKLKNDKANQENGSSEQASKTKKLTVTMDNLYEVDTKVTSSQKPTSKSVGMSSLESDKEKQVTRLSVKKDERKSFSLKGLFDEEKTVPADLDKECVKSEMEQAEVNAETEPYTTKIDNVSTSLEKNIPDVKKDEKEIHVTEVHNEIKVNKEESTKGRTKEIKNEEQKHVKVDETSSIDYDRIKDIHSMDSPRDILEYLENCFVNKQLSEGHRLSLFSDAIKRLKSLEPVPISPIIANNVFQILEKNIFVSEIDFFSIKQMSEYLLETSSVDDNLTETLLHEISWRLRTLPIKATLDIFEMLEMRQTTAKRREVHKLATERLKEIIGTVSSPYEVISLLRKLINTDAQQRVEQEALAMLHVMDCTETYKLLQILVNNRSKNYTLMVQAKQHLFSRPINLSFVQLQNLFYICSRLNVKDDKDLKEISVNFLEYLQNNSLLNKSNNLIAVLHSCSVLGWNYKPLTCKIIEELINDEKLFDNQNEKALKDILLSLSFLNLENFKGFGRKIASHLMSNNKLTKNFHLDIVNSLACFNIAEREEVLEVLQPAFYQPVLDSLNGKPKFLQQSVKFKLMGLYGYLKEDLKETSVEVDGIVSKWREELQAEMETEPQTNFGKSVSKIMANVAPLYRYTKLNVVNRYGYIIDFEFFVDQSLKSVRLTDSQGKQRVCIKLLPSNGLVNEDGEIKPSTKTTMMMRHLLYEKDTVFVFVNFFEWQKLQKKSDRLLHLESLIKSAVRNYRKSIESDAGGSIEKGNLDKKKY